MNRPQIFWPDVDRFDVKPNKSPWLEMAQALMAHGFDVKIVTGYEKERYQAPNSKVRIVYLRALNMPWLFQFSLLLRVALWLIRRVGKDDIVILSPVTLLIAPILWMVGIRRLHLDIRTVPLDNPAVKRRVGRWLSWKITVGRLRKLVVGYSFITERLKKAVEEEFDTKFDDYVIWQSGVNTKKFQAATATKAAKASEGFILFYHGSVYKSRGIEKVIKAIAELKQEYEEILRFVIVGHGTGLEELQRLVEVAGLSNEVVFEGYIPYEEIPGYISKAACCICPLPDLFQWNVSSPLKVFEYMACAKPMILTPIPAHLDVMKGQEFVIWTKGDEVSDFREAIVDAVKNRERLQEAARMGPTIVQQSYDWNAQGAKLASYWKKKMLTGVC